MRYSIIINKLADSHLKRIEKSGDKTSLRKVKQIFEELELHPTTGTGSPELLKHNLTGFWSRRINKKDRLIYQIIEEPNHLVVIISALGHY